MSHQQNEEDLKGYPHYPASEDITRPTNNNGRERLETTEPIVPFNDAIDPRDAEGAVIAASDADISDDEALMLEYAAQNLTDTTLFDATLDAIDDEGTPLHELSSLSHSTDGSTLDIPGSEDDDIQENIGSEDEENNYYSLGGDNHTSLDENA